jgi:hypothetical protein
VSRDKPAGRSRVFGLIDARNVTTCDFPEAADIWCELGREADFGEAREVFVDPTDFFRLFR